MSKGACDGSSLPVVQKGRKDDRKKNIGSIPSLALLYDIRHILMTYVILIYLSTDMV